VLRQTPRTANFFYCRNHRHCGVIDGQEIQLKELGKAALSWIEDTQALLFDKILCGLPIPADFEERIRSACDNFTEWSVGYSLLDMPCLREWSDDVKAWLFLHIV